MSVFGVAANGGRSRGRCSAPCRLAAPVFGVCANAALASSAVISETFKASEAHISRCRQVTVDFVPSKSGTLLRPGSGFCRRGRCLRLLILLLLSGPAAWGPWNRLRTGHLDIYLLHSAFLRRIHNQ